MVAHATDAAAQGKGGAELDPAEVERLAQEAGRAQHSYRGRKTSVVSGDDAAGCECEFIVESRHGLTIVHFGSDRSMNWPRWRRKMCVRERASDLQMLTRPPGGGRNSRTPAPPSPQGARRLGLPSHIEDRAVAMREHRGSALLHVLATVACEWRRARAKPWRASSPCSPPHAQRSAPREIWEPP